MKTKQDEPSPAKIRHELAAVIGGLQTASTLLKDSSRKNQDDLVKLITLCLNKAKEILTTLDREKKKDKRC